MVTSKGIESRKNEPNGSFLTQTVPKWHPDEDKVGSGNQTRMKS
jgi:hypothetical protein